MSPELYSQIEVGTESMEDRLFWANELGVTEEVFCNAVLKAGRRLNDVRAELGLARILIFPGPQHDRKFHLV